VYASPIGEIETLHGTPPVWKGLTIQPGDDPLKRVSGDSLEIVAEIEPGTATEVGFGIGGRSVGFRVKDRGGGNTLTSGDLTTPLRLNNGRFTVRILVDRASIEVFGSEGETFIPSCFLPDGSKSVELSARGGAAKAVRLEVYPLRSIRA
jgi:fructan beta-fructosidase